MGCHALAFARASGCFSQHGDLTRLNPMRYFMVILLVVFLEGLPFDALMDQCWPMAVIGVVNLIVAGWLFRHRMYQQRGLLLPSNTGLFLFTAFSKEAIVKMKGTKTSFQRLIRRGKNDRLPYRLP